MIAAATSTSATAQTFVDLYAGRALPERATAAVTEDKARIDDAIIPAELHVEVESLQPTKSTIYGARVGHWFNWFGFAIDASTLDADVEKQAIEATANLRFDEEVLGQRVAVNLGPFSVDIPRVTVPTTATIAALAMVRLPNRTIKPYAFAGPVYLITDTKLAGNWGMRAGGGLEVALSWRLALFGEYRYTHVDASAVAGRLGGRIGDLRGDTGDIRVDMTLENHSTIAGIRFSF